MEHTVTVSDLPFNPGNSTPSQPQMKHGNSGKMSVNSFSDKFVSLTYHTPKQLSGYDSRDGGKITDQANVGG